MDINKILTKTGEIEREQIVLKEDLFERNWRVIQQKIQTESINNVITLPKKKVKVKYYKEALAVAGFVAVLVLVPTLSRKYVNTDPKPNPNNPAVINNAEAYDKTYSVKNNQVNIKEQKRVEEIITQIAKKQYGNFMISDRGLIDWGTSGKYHQIIVFQITKGQKPNFTTYFVKPNTDEVYVQNGFNLIRYSEGVACESFTGKGHTNPKEPLISTLVGNGIQLRLALRNNVDTGKYELYENSNKEVLYAVEVSTKDIYKYNGNIEKMELVYKNQLNNEKVTKKINEDLNGDGVKEEIKLDYYNEVLTVNDMSIAADIDTIKGISVVDINKKDALREIVIKDKGSNDYDGLNFYYYDGKNFVTSHFVQGEDLEVDGSGKIIVKNQMADLYEVLMWHHDEEYMLTENYGFKEVPRDMYLMQEKIKVIHELQLQKSQTDDSIAFTLAVGETGEIIQCDDKSWCCIKNTNGAIGWFQVKNGVIVPINMAPENVFQRIR